MNQPAVSNPPASRTVATLVLFIGLFLFAYTVPWLSGIPKEMAATFGVEPDQTKPVVVAYFLAWLIIIPPFGILADRFGRKNLLMIGSLTASVGMLLLSYATTISMACAANFLIGSGTIILQIVGVAVLTDMFAEKRGNALSMAVGIVGLIAILSPMLMGELVFGYQVPWYLVVRYSAVLPILAFIAQFTCTFPPAAAAVPITAKTVVELLSNPRFLLCIFAMFVYGIIEQGVPNYAPTYIDKELHAEAVWGTRTVAAYFWIMSLTRVLIGQFRLFEKVPYPKMITVCGLIGAACVLLGTLPQNTAMTVIFLAALGGAIAQIWPAIMTFAVETTGKPTTTVFGFVVGIGGASGVLLGIAAPPYIERLGWSSQHLLLMFIIPSLLLAVIFGLMMLANRGPTDKK